MGKSCVRAVETAMTARAVRLTERARGAEPGRAQTTSVPANTIRVFVDALERLGYPTKSLNAFAVEFGVVLTVLHLRNEVDGKFNVLSVTFSHEPDDAAEIELLLGCAIHANSSWNGFQLTREVLEMPMRRRDHALRGVLER